MAVETETALSHLLARRLTDLLPLFGILAAISYAVLRLAYLQFYYSFMVTPEEVGLGQAELLTQSLVAPLFLLVLTIILVIVLGSLLLVVGVILEHLAKLLSNLRPRLPIIRRIKFFRSTNKSQVEAEAISSNGETTQVHEPMTRAGRSNEASISLNPIAGIVVAVVAVTFLIIIFAQANKAAADVRNGGYTITTVHLEIGQVKIPTLNIVAWPSSVEWKESTNTPSTLKQYPNCIMYLGEADGTAVIYNVKTQTTMRFRSDDAIVAVYSSRARLDPSCYE
jgi:hypothetical protein